jgi:hypothetical protein
LDKPHPNEITRSHKEQKPLTQYGETKKLKEYRHWLLGHKSTSTAMEKLLTVALDDDHSGQMQALKILADRILPLSGFAAENQHARAAVQINITGYNEKPMKTASSQEAEGFVEIKEVITEEGEVVE